MYQVLPKGALTSESKAELQSGLDLLMKIARDCDGEGEKRDASQSQEKDKANAGVLTNSLMLLPHVIDRPQQ